MKTPFVATLAALLAFGQADPVFKSTTQLIVVDVFVRDRSGKDILGLNKQDFTLIEDGKPQQIQVFEVQRLEDIPAPAPVAAPPKPPEAPKEVRPQTITARAAGQIQYRDKRLLVLFFDLSSMQPPEQLRAEKAAVKFINENMTSADMVAVMSFASKLKVDLDFTDNREDLLRVVQSYRMGEGSAFATEAPTGDEETSEDTGAAFEADESEFNIFNTDRKLGALESAAKMLAALPEKKALVYFSSGVGKTGVENESQLRSTLNAAVRANLSFYPVDARGLVATVPGGDASQAASRGTGLFSGQSQRQQQSRMQNQQETLSTLASDTGGKVFLDSNDLSLGIVQAQTAIRSYYILGYYSSNPAQDGSFRRIQVRLNGDSRQAKLDYRSGYYAAKEFSKFNASDKEQQLEEALALGDPVTDLTIALEVNYFRLSRGRYFVPVAVKIPGAEVVLAKRGGSETAEVDFIGQIRDSRGRLAGTVRDAIRIKLDVQAAAQIEKRNFQYDTGFTLEPGKYTIKFLARENQNGKIGTFESRFVVPELAATGGDLPVSSIVLGSQREALTAAVGAAESSRKRLGASPLVDGGQKLIPSITRVFRKDQSLYLYGEVYDPGIDAEAKKPSLQTSVSFYRGRTKAFESPLVLVTESLPRRPGVLPLRFEIPLAAMTPGPYTCQINVIDEVGRKFAFPRSSLVVLAAK